jgi:hypothetical protein
MAIVSFENTNHLLNQWSNNEPGDSQEVANAASESWKAVGKDIRDPTLPHTRQYIQEVHQYLQSVKAEKREDTENKIAWHLASHSNRMEAKKKSDDDLLERFKSQKSLLEEKPSPDSVEPLKRVEALIKKAEAIKSDAAKLSPLLHTPTDIWKQIIFQNQYYWLAGLSNLRSISKQFDGNIQDLMINEINVQKLNFSDLGLYTVKEITEFFGDKIKQLKHISFSLDRKNEAMLGKALYLREKSLSEKSSQNGDEQKLFTVFIKALRKIESFSFDHYTIKEPYSRPTTQPMNGDILNLNNHYNLLIHKQSLLNKDLFIELCKNNPDLTELNISNHISRDDFQKGLTHLKNLKSLTINPPEKDMLTLRVFELYRYLPLPELYNIKEFKHPGLEQQEIEYLKNFTNIEKIDIGFSSPDAGATIPHTIEVLKDTSVKELSINANITGLFDFLPNENFIGPYSHIEFNTTLSLPPKLQKLVLISANIDLSSLLRLAQSSALTELQLEGCGLDCSDVTQLLQLFSQCQNLQKVYFIGCAYVYKKKLDNLVEKLQKANLHIQIIYEQIKLKKINFIS